jgi:P27 family predicted phage terminase small subunit
MGERGPAKKPAAAHKRNGTYRDDRHGGAKLPVRLPSAPRDMTASAKRHWQKNGKLLEEAGYVSEIDSLSLRLLCESVDQYLAALKHIGTYGLTVVETFKHGEREVINPAVKIKASAWREIVMLCRQFGMTPSARTGLPSGETDVGNDMASVLGFKVVS